MLASPEQRLREENIKGANTDARLKTNYHVSKHAKKSYSSGLFSLLCIQKQALIEHLPCVLFFLGPLRRWGQISEKQGASNQPLYVYTQLIQWTLPVQQLSV